MSATIAGGNNILVTSAGRRVSLVREFQAELKKWVCGGKVFVSEMNPAMASATQVADGCFTVPHVLNPEYPEILLRICVENGIRVVVPTIDTELAVLARLKKLAAEVGVSILVPDEEFVALCRDKRNTGAFFRSRGIRVPATIDKSSPTFPLFAKPYDGSLSKDVFIVHSREELTPEIMNHPKLMFMELIDKKIYKEFTADMYFGRDGNLKCVVPRERVEIRAGEINKGFTRGGFLLDFLRERFSEIKGCVGCICVQLFYDEKSRDVVGIEINPRFGGGYPLSFGAGANFPQNIVREYFLGESLSYSDDWARDLLMLRYDAEIFVPKSRNRGGVAVFDLDDTLFKELDFLRSAFHEIAEYLAGAVGAKAVYDEMLAMRSRGGNVFKNIAARFGVSVADLFTRYRNHVPTLRLTPEVRFTLKTLRSRGVYLGLITDGRSRTQRNKIRALGLDEFFDAENIVVSEEFGSEKPACRNYEFFEKKFPHSNFCYVGDNPEKDFIAPNKLGWESVCLLGNGENVHPQSFDLVPAAALPKIKIESLLDLL